jgi:hypothetical protein
MKRIAHAAGMLVLTFSCEAFAQRDALTIDCTGAFARSTSHAKLVAAFGRNNVVSQKVQDAEGETPVASVVFPKDPRKRADFIWTNQEQRREPRVRINGSGWRTPHGIAVGATLKDVERLNGKPFQLSGFGWDVGGRTTSWNKGALDKPLPGGCRLHVDFAADSKAPDKLVDKVTGDKTFNSNDPAMAAVKPTVTAIVIYYPDR